MASWSQLQLQLNAVPIQQRGDWLQAQINREMQALATLTNCQVIVYASSYLQKPQVPGILVSITPEDINGFLSALHGMDCSRGLLLVLHTPGGSAEAAETIVSYLWSKFSDITTLIPTYAMSAGTMIALASNRLIMGRQSQLGPTDPQFFMGGGTFSAHSIVKQFEEAKSDIIGNPELARAWAPVLQPFGPALLQEARKALVYGQSLVTDWLTKRMFNGTQDAVAHARRAAKHFSGDQHGSHGKRIDRTEARSLGLTVEDLELNQPLQVAALTLYHALTLAFENGPGAKAIISSNGSTWMKNMSMQVIGTGLSQVP
jgi:ATP-dependent protease ClpP protease subunit